MSTLTHEDMLLDIFDEVQENFPYLDEDKQIDDSEDDICLIQLPNLLLWSQYRYFHVVEIAICLPLGYEGEPWTRISAAPASGASDARAHTCPRERRPNAVATSMVASGMRHTSVARVHHEDMHTLRPLLSESSPTELESVDIHRRANPLGVLLLSVARVMASPG